MSSSKSAKEPSAMTLDHLKTKSCISHLAGLSAVQNLRREAKSQAKSREAEADAARRALWSGDRQPEDEDVGDTIVFGDLVQQPPPQPPPKPALGTLAKLGIGVALIASGAGVGLGLPVILDALRPAAVAPQPPTNTTTTIERDYSIGDIRIE